MTNHLATATSPYLLQHKDNPVHWWPWSVEAFNEAEERDVPVLLSIGYSACHWCHVMAHESFEDQATADTINAGFVAIKVDREERPDIDSIYIDAVQNLTGSAGWPLTVFLTSRGQPFYGGTYFPNRPVGSTPSFSFVLEAITSAWQTRRDELVDQSERLVLAIESAPEPPSDVASLDLSGVLAASVARFAELFDEEFGGIGSSPKFPQPPMLELMLQAHMLGHKGCLEMVTDTLLTMASGGIYDQLGGGFHRYSTDRFWRVPHFEKMLYDQALLARLYLHAYLVTHDSRLLQVLKETLSYVMTELAGSDGGLCSAEDADSEGVEGLFYTWTPAEIDRALGPDRGKRFAWFYGVTESGDVDGRSTLHLADASDISRPADIEGLREDLERVRTARVRPGLDDKVLTEWNAMSCSVLAEAALLLDEPNWKRAALSIGEFLLSNLRSDDGRWMRSYRAGKASNDAVAADYAWLVDCFTRLSELTGERRWIDRARSVADDLIGLFSDEHGGWFMTGSDAERLVVRPRDGYDGVVPSAASVAARGLSRLGALTGESRYLTRADATIQNATRGLELGPLAYPELICAALARRAGPIEIVIAGERPDLLETLRDRYMPDVVLAWGEPTSSPIWVGRDDDRGYVCRSGTCLAPVSSSDDLLAAIDSARSGL